jgi:arylsulfatase A-like enzyme
MAQRPNIVFILTDDQRFDTIGALGNPHVHTPNLNALVEAGTTFTQACIPGGTSPAVCMPSRAMLHTGRTLFHLHGAGAELPDEHTTLGECLRGHGYRTFGTGKWHNGPRAYHRSFSDGDEIFFGGMADHWNVPVHDYDPHGHYDHHCAYVENPFYSNTVQKRWCDHIHAGHHSTDLIANATIRFIEKQSATQPFFAYTAFLAPHDPRTMPPQYLALYDPEMLPLPPNFMGGHPFDNGELHVRDEQLAGYPRTPEEIRRHLAEYYAMISHLDDRIGEIIAAVRRQGMWENTIFILAGDNGIALGQHGLMGKQSLYEHSIRVPLLFAGPGIPHGMRRDAQVYLLDVYPTLCELVGITTPTSVEGISMIDALMQGAPARKACYLAYTDKHRGVRTAQHKLIEYRRQGRCYMTQLFDLAADPWETHNRAEDPAAAPVLHHLQQLLLGFRNAWDDCGTEWGQGYWGETT